MLKEHLRRLFASQAEIEADDERIEVLKHGTQPVESCQARHRALVSGVIRSVTYAPAGGAPALVAELYDGSGRIDLVWLGRRQIVGISPGRRLIAEGMVCPPDSGQAHPQIFNPSYRLLAAQDVA